MINPTLYRYVTLGIHLKFTVFIIYCCYNCGGFDLQVLLELAQLVSHDYPSVDDMLSKMAAIILPVTKAQYCTVFISDDNSTVVQKSINVYG